MKLKLLTIIILSLPLFLNINTLSCQVFINATGGTISGTYSSVKQTFDAINNGIHTGTIIITIGNSDGQIITETLQASLNKSGVGGANYSSISIFPGAANIKVTGAISGACCVPSGTIRLNQAENVTIDGRQGGVGSTIDLTIENTTVGSYSSAFVFFAASNNTLKYCLLKSATTGSCCGVGTISITDNNISGGTGSNNNVIEYCEITKSGSNIPRRAIFGKGATGRENTNNIIRNCNIYDFQEYGIFIGNSTSGEGYNRNWTIKDNAIYQIMPFATMNYNQIGICVGNPFSANYGEQGTFIIENNTVGGNGSGGDWTCKSNFARRVAGISINTTTTGYTLVKANTVFNFDVSTTNTSTDYGQFSGIVVSNGKVNITENIIGSLTQTDNIKVYRANSTNGGMVSGIQVRSSSDLENIINYNTVSGVSITAGNSNFFNMYGIRNLSATTYPADSIYHNNVSYLKSTKSNYCIAIYGQGLIAKNRVRDIDFTGSASFSELTGIKWLGGDVSGSGARGIENNEIILGTNKSGVSIGNNDKITGINITRGDAEVYYNSVLIQGATTSADDTYAIVLPNSIFTTFNNNLMYNERTGGTGKHYAIYSPHTNNTWWTSSNNAYVIGTNANNYLGYWGGDISTLITWQSVSGETNSIGDNTTGQPTNVLFPLLAQDSLDIADPSWLQAGIPVVPTTDITDISRALIPSIGAYEKSVILPIELLQFKSICQYNQVNLLWTTSSESNNDYFTIQKSSDGLNFEDIAYISGAGNSNRLQYYNFSDNTILSETVYYRLKQTDYDGRFSYSGIILADCNNVDTKEFKVFPNPANEKIHILFDSEPALSYQYTISDCLGKTVMSGKLEKNKNTFLININNLSQGIYTISIYNNTGKTYKTIVKN